MKCCGFVEFSRTVSVAQYGHGHNATELPRYFPDALTA